MATSLVVFVLLVLLACLAHGEPDGDSASVSVSVSVSERDSVTLHTDLKINPQDKIKWYFNDMRIAQIKGNQSKICTDDECKERFRDSLKLDEHTGDLTITNINTTDFGHYQLKSSSEVIGEKIFIVAVQGVPAAERDEMKRKSVKEGEYVVLDPDVEKNSNDVMTWYFNDILINEINGDPSKICEDDQCDERFRDRLKLDHQTGSLTITNTRTTDSGEYTLKISSHKHHHCHGRCTVTSLKNFHVDVVGSGRSSAVRAVVIVSVLTATVTTVGLIYNRCTNCRNGQERWSSRDLRGFH